jgi:DNA-binding transcriptional LysR family regulator
LLAKHPGLSVDLHLEDRLVDLVADGIDVAVRCGVGPANSASIVARTLFVYRRIAVASPGYLARHDEPETPAALSRHDTIVHLGAARTSKTAHMWRFRRAGVETAVEVRGTLRTNAVYAIRDAAVAGMGIAVLPEWLVQDDVAAARLRPVLPDYDAPLVTVSAVYRTEHRATPAVKAFVRHFADRN